MNETVSHPYSLEANAEVLMCLTILNETLYYIDGYYKLGKKRYTVDVCRCHSTLLPRSC